MVPYVSYINLKSLWENYSFLNVCSFVSRHIKFQMANPLCYKTKKIFWNKLLYRNFDIRIITRYKSFRRSTELEQRTCILVNLLTETILAFFFWYEWIWLTFLGILTCLTTFTAIKQTMNSYSKWKKKCRHHQC